MGFLLGLGFHSLDYQQGEFTCRCFWSQTQLIQTKMRCHYAGEPDDAVLEYTNEEGRAWLRETMQWWNTWVHLSIAASEGASSETEQPNW